MSKTALVLSGGGFRGAFQAGALETIRKYWDLINPGIESMKFDIVSGVSAGALNGLMIAQNNLDELLAIWKEVAVKGVTEIYTSDFIDTNFDKDTDNPELRFKLSWDTIKEYFPKTTHNLLLKAIFSRKSIFKSFEKEFQAFRALADNTPLYKKLRVHAKKELLKNCNYKCGFVSLDTGSYYYVNGCDFKTDDDLAKGVLASTTMPIVWSPVNRIDLAHTQLKQCVDGGIRNVSPLGDVINDIKNDPSPEEYTLIIINCSTGTLSEEDYSNKNIAQIALRSLDDIAITEIFNNDIREFITKNYLVKQVKDNHPGEILYDYDFENKQRGKPLKYFNAIIIQPDPNVLGDALTANERQIQLRMDHGRQKAEIAINLHYQSKMENKTTIV